jgi:hypothetical protein
MSGSTIETAARRLRWAVWAMWCLVAAAYLAGRFGLTFGAVQVEARSSMGDQGLALALADATIALLTVAMFQLSRMLSSIASGDLFSARVIGAFRAFAFWLLLLAIAWIVAPIAAALWAGPGPAHRLAVQIQLRDILTVGITLMLFLVARLLERARLLHEEMREFV